MTAKPYAPPALDPIGRVHDVTATYDIYCKEHDFDGSHLAVVEPGDGVGLLDSSDYDAGA